LNNPIRFIDPTGLTAMILLGEGFGPTSIRWKGGDNPKVEFGDYRSLPGALQAARNLAFQKTGDKKFLTADLALVNNREDFIAGYKAAGKDPVYWAGHSTMETDAAGEAKPPAIGVSAGSTSVSGEEIGQLMSQQKNDAYFDMCFGGTMKLSAGKGAKLAHGPKHWVTMNLDLKLTDEAKMNADQGHPLVLHRDDVEKLSKIGVVKANGPRQDQPVAPANRR
jgi:hypothetical protein